VKRGILSREASGQIIEYYGLLKSQFPDRSIELILCANTIPHERKTFLENFGIECKEISVSRIIEVADKYHYSFLDSNNYKKENVKYSEINQSITASEDGTISAWIFQANPKEYDVLNALADEKVGDKIHWYVGQHKGKIVKGHIALIWMSGKEGGVYAVAKILSNPEETEEYPEEKKYWINTTKETTKLLRVKLKVIKRLINYPIFRNELKNIPQLKNLSILKFAQGTNFPVTSEEWKILSKLITDRKY
jgi:predicted RNA-binding protein with PUA-like domain